MERRKGKNKEDFKIKAKKKKKGEERRLGASCTNHERIVEYRAYYTFLR